MGGLRPEYEIGDLVWPDQFVDWTKGRPSTFFAGPKGPRFSTRAESRIFREEPPSPTPR